VATAVQKRFWGHLSSSLTKGRFHFLSKYSRGRHNSIIFAERIIFFIAWAYKLIA
jgi:hypothetical protein